MENLSILSHQYRHATRFIDDKLLSITEKIECVKQRHAVNLIMINDKSDKGESAEFKRINDL
ncbi:hypothetical protein LguiB_007171 [Lonicera macranthoides]